MSIETEPKTENPYERMTPEELEAKKIELEAQIAEALDKIREKEKIIAEGKEKNPRLKKELEELQKEREENEEKKKEPEKAVSALKQSLAKVKTKYFVEMTPKRRFFDPEFMRYVPGDKYMALMEGDRLNDDEKERATRARFKFCFDWLKSEDYKEYEKKREDYERAFDDWLENPVTPYPIDQKKYEEDLKRWKEMPEDERPRKPPEPKLLKEPEMPPGGDIRETFRNDIRNIKELILINNYIPDLFDEFGFVGHIRFPMIGEIRKNESFAGRGRHIRETKLEDFIQIIRHLESRNIGKGNSEKYFDTFDKTQLDILRERMKERFKGKERSEIAGMGSRTWKSPITIDLIDRTILQGFRVSDEEDKYLIVKHLLLAYKVRGEGKMSEQNEDALRWLISLKEGALFYNTVEVAKEVGIDNIGEIAKELNVKLFDGLAVEKK